MVFKVLLMAHGNAYLPLFLQYQLWTPEECYQAWDSLGVMAPTICSG